MNYIYLTKEEKDNIYAIIKRGQEIGKKVDDVIKKINEEKEKGLAFVKNLKIKGVL